MSEDLSITLVNTASGQSETLPLPRNMTVKEVAELAVALFGMSLSPSSSVALFKDGKGLNPNATLAACGVQAGDLLAAQEQHQRPRPPAPVPAQAASSGGGFLDFSNLLGGGNNVTSSAVAPSSTTATTTTQLQAQNQPGPPVYYPGMSVEDAIEYNPHPHNFVTLIRQHEHLFKEFRYHQPFLAEKIYLASNLEQATQIWREEQVKMSIANAVKHSEYLRKEQEMKQRLQQNPNDPLAKEYYAEIEKKRNIELQYVQMMNEYPESLGKVLMLYVEAKINGHAIQAFCDSGAQMTIMSKAVAAQCGLLDLVDMRFKGVAAGVGTGKILGRVHLVQLQIGKAYYPCSVTVMDDPPPGATEMPFLLGLDMMKRHLCQIDLAKGVLRFTAGHVEEVPFLHEKDLDQAQGGTKGFDAEKANEEIRKLLEKHGNGGDDNDGDGDDAMEDSE